MKRILVVREPDDFSRILTEKGFQIVNLPMIETKRLENLRDFENRLDEIEIYDGIFLTSRHAARILADKLREKRVNYKGKVYILGSRSFETLKDENLDLVYDENANSAREMLESIELENLKSKRFLFVRGEKSLGVVPDFLKKFAVVDESVVYETGKIEIAAEKIKEIGVHFENGEIAAACFFSPSAAESFLEQFGATVLHQTVIATIGQTTAEFFERRNLKVGFVSPKASAENFASELIEYLRKEN